MRNISISMLLFLVVALSGCLTNFDMEVKETLPRLVVDGLITNKQGPYYVRLIKSNVAVINGYETEDQYIDEAEAVLDAQIIISDDYGQVDTLRPAIYNPAKEYLTGERGYYQTNSLQGIPSHTYSLKIKSGDKEYTSECYMPSVPVIDSIDYIVQPGEIGKFDNYIPRIYFKEPQDDKNYYLINYFTYENYVDLGWVEHTLWQYFILSDEYLDPYVKALCVENGSAPTDFGYYWIFPGDKVAVRLISLTYDAYNYYKILLEQFEYDGGTYKPTPASPPSNISNGALGFFRASAISQKNITIPGGSDYY